MSVFGFMFDEVVLDVTLEKFFGWTVMVEKKYVLYFVFECLGKL